jgi:RNA polymerase sigma-70 factor (ECF subfamily)
VTKQGAGPTDAELVIAARGGDAWAQEALFQRHVRLVTGLAHRIMTRDSDVDDLVQDCFVYALERLETLDNPQAFASWIASIVVRTAGKRLRKRKLLTRLGLLRDTPIDPDDIISRAAPPDVASELRAIYTALDRLPAEQRIAIVLRRVEGLEISEIADQMGLSVATVKRRLSAAEERIAKLRARL